MNPPLRLLAAFQQASENEPQQLLQLEDRIMWVAAETTGGLAYTVIAADMEVRTTFDRRSAKRKKTTRNRPLPKWAYYMAGAVGILDRKGFEMEGATIVIAGDEPLGPRYEHALGLAFVAFWYQLNNKDYSNQDLADIIDRVHRDYVGVK